MRLALSLLALAIAALPADAQASRFRFSVPGYQAPVLFDSVASVIEIDAPKGPTFNALSLVFQELKIPVDTRDSVSGLIGNPRITKMRNFAGAPMSRLLNCGYGMTGQHADNWRIYLTVLAVVEGRGSDRSTLRLAFIAGAQDMEGASKDAVMCATTGRLETMITDRVKDRVAQLPSS